MKSITVDFATAEKLLAPGRPVDICDDAGNVVGRFVPTTEPDECKVVEQPPAKKK